MKNLGLIIRREYWVRVRHKYFLLGTFLAPLGFLLLMTLPILAITLGSSPKTTVYVIDPTDTLAQKLKGGNELEFRLYEGNFESLRDSIQGSEEKAALVLPGDISKIGDLQVDYFSAKPPGMSLERQLKSRVQDVLKEARLSNVGISRDELERVEFDLDFTSHKVLEEGEEETSTELASIVGYAMAFLIYFMIAIYGSMVMKGVLEEKTNRIVEVMVSSVRPIELMFGKVIGIGLVGFTQILLWLILVIIIGIVFNIVLAGMIDPETLQQASAGQGGAGEAEEMALKIQTALKNFDFSILWFFPVFFVGGFFIYGSLYAALAASADQESDVQSLSFVVFFPLIIPILLLAPIIGNPNGALAFWGSIIPLFSPIIMMIRLASTDVALWEIILSLVLLGGGVVGISWLAARIYRVGILLYGQKPKLKDLVKWIFIKN